MTVYDLPHVTVTPKANDGMFLIQADEGWCIHLPEHGEGVYKRSVGLLATYDFSTVQIINVNDLPEGAEILEDETKPEVM
jgi:hypothetical protein